MIGLRLCSCSWIGRNPASLAVWKPALSVPAILLVPAVLVAALLLRPGRDLDAVFDDWEDVSALARDSDRLILVEVLDPRVPLAPQMRRTWDSRELAQAREGRLLRYTVDAQAEPDEAERRAGRRAALGTALVETDGAVVSFRPGLRTAGSLVRWIDGVFEGLDRHRRARVGWEAGDRSDGAREGWAAAKEAVGDRRGAIEVLQGFDDAAGEADSVVRRDALLHQAWLVALEGRSFEAREALRRWDEAVEPTAGTPPARRRLIEALLLWVDRRPQAVLDGLPAHAPSGWSPMDSAAHGWIVGRAQHETGDDEGALSALEEASAAAAGPWWEEVIEEATEHILESPHSHPVDRE